MRQKACSLGACGVAPAAAAARALRRARLGIVQEVGVAEDEAPHFGAEALLGARRLSGSARARMRNRVSRRAPVRPARRRGRRAPAHAAGSGRGTRGGQRVRRRVRGARRALRHARCAAQGALRRGRARLVLRIERIHALVQVHHRAPRATAGRGALASRRGQRRRDAPGHPRACAELSLLARSRVYRRRCTHARCSECWLPPLPTRSAALQLCAERVRAAALPLSARCR